MLDARQRKELSPVTYTEEQISTIPVVDHKTDPSLTTPVAPHEPTSAVRRAITNGKAGSERRLRAFMEESFLGRKAPNDLIAAKPYNTYRSASFP